MLHTYLCIAIMDWTSNTIYQPVVTFWIATVSVIASLHHVTLYNFSISMFKMENQPTPHIYHIVVSRMRTIDWVHVGEVRFFDKPANEITELCPEEPSPGEVTLLCDGLIFNILYVTDKSDVLV